MKIVCKVSFTRCFSWVKKRKHPKVLLTTQLKQGVNQIEPVRTEKLS